MYAAYLQTRPALLRYFAAKLGSMAAAEDIVQEIYLRIPAEAEPDAVRDPKAWLFRVGTNLLIDARRRAGRTSAREHAWIDGDERAGGERVAPEPSAEAVVAARQRLAKLVRLVDAMPPRMAQAFRLHKFEGLPQAEVARRMGVSIKAVEKHLAGALERLVGEMGEQGPSSRVGVDHVGVV